MSIKENEAPALVSENCSSIQVLPGASDSCTIVISDANNGDSHTYALLESYSWISNILGVITVNPSA